MATNLSVTSEVHVPEIPSKAASVQVQTQRSAPHLKTLTLSLEVFVRLMHAMDRTHSYNLQLFMFCFALNASPNMDYKLYHEALPLFPTNHCLYTEMLVCLGMAIAVRHQQEGDFEKIADINEAISVLRKLIPLTQPTLNIIPLVLAKVLRARYMRLHDPRDLENSISHFHLALQRSSLSRSDEDESSNGTLDLAITLLIHFGRSDDIAILDQALHYFRECDQRLPPDHYDSMRCTTYYLRTLIKRYKKTHNRGDIEEATRHLVTVMTGYQRPDRISILLEFAESMVYWEQVGIVSHLNLTISCLEEAIQHLPGEEKHRKPVLLVQLANAYRSRFEELAGSADLDSWVSYIKDALDLCPPSHPHYPGYMMTT